MQVGCEAQRWVAILSELWEVELFPRQNSSIIKKRKKEKKNSSITLLLYICLLSHTGNHMLILIATLGSDISLPLVTCWDQYTNHSPPKSHGLSSAYSLRSEQWGGASTSHQEATTIWMKVYTTLTPGPDKFQGLVLVPWPLRTALQYAQGRPAATQMGWLSWMWRPDVGARCGHIKPVTAVKGSWEPRSGLHLRVDQSGEGSSGAGQGPSWPRPFSSFGIVVPSKRGTQRLQGA